MIKRYRIEAEWLGHAGAHQSHTSLGREARATLACGLRWLARRLRWAAQRLGRQVGTRPASVAELEFYAEADATDGALYQNGELVGHLRGVNRL